MGYPHVCGKMSTHIDDMVPWKASGAKITWKNLERAQLWYLHVHIEVFEIIFYILGIRCKFSYTGNDMMTSVHFKDC